MAPPPRTSPLGAALRRDLPVHGLVALYLCAVWITGAIAGADNPTQLVHPRVLLTSATHVLGLVALSAFALSVGWLLSLVLRRVHHPLARTRDALRALTGRPAELWAFAAVLASMIVFVPAYSTLKTLIPVLQEFRFDAVFASVDRGLHLGTDPWRITHALVPWATGTGLVNFAYHGWFFALWGVLLIFLLQVDRPRLRLRYLLAQLLLWMVAGSLLATLLSSAGPCYHDRVVDDDGGRFAPLMTRLAEQRATLAAGGSPLDLWALDVQEELWAQHSDERTRLGGGISAMPSLHVGIAVLMALGLMQLGRAWGLLGWAFAALTQFGSVHLGWHYAIDGYLSALVAVALWALTGWWTRRLLPAD